MDLKRHKIQILGVEVDDISPEMAIGDVLKLALDKKKSHYVVTVNSEFVMLARRNRDFLHILNKADLAVADGMGVVFAKLILGGREQNRIAGVDLVEKLCAKCAKGAIRVGFLGGFGDVAQIVAKRQKDKNPGLKVAVAEPGDWSIGRNSRLKSKFSAIGRIDLLFVAYGMGRQEFWIDSNKNRLDVGVFIGVGGAFDYLAGVKSRAPKLLQNWGLEWFWRLAMEPARFWRMRVLPIFLILVLWQWVLPKSVNKTKRVQ